MVFWIIFSLQIFSEFVIGIDISKCPPLRLPANGYVVCDHLIGAFCAPVCNSGFVPETQPAQAYVCNPLRKAWATYPGGYPLPWPNCIRSTKPEETAKSTSAIKKSIVGQQIASPVDQQMPANGKESLWQRMLSLTSQLTQSKYRQEAGGAARSIQTPDNRSSDNNSNNNNNNLNVKAKGSEDSSVSNSNSLTGSDNSVNGNNNLNIYSQTTPYPSYQSDVNPTQGEEEKKLQHRRLQQYWDEYYKRYYESIGKGKLPDWMTRSPWSNDPEQVQGALDTDMYNMAGSLENNTRKEYWSNYLQNYYLQYPRPEANRTDSENVMRTTNTSSDALIENVIENDLESKNMLDKNLNKDLYYEDQLIHREEKKRPRLNFLYYLPTTRPKTNNATTVSYPLSNTASSHQNPAYPYQAENSSKNSYEYNVSAPVNAVGQQNALAERNASSSSAATLTKTATTSDYNSRLQGNSTLSQSNDLQTSSKSSSSQSDTAVVDPYERYKQYFKEYYNKIRNSSRAGNETQVTSGVNMQDVRNASSDNAHWIPQQTESNTTSLKVPKLSNLANLLKSTSKDDVTNQVGTTYLSAGQPEDDDTDYLDQLDISALVRELIKLETIRKERKLAKKKHLEREHSRDVANSLSGDITRGYFRAKIVPPQKGLKKHLLRNAKSLAKSKSNQSPLPKFSR